MGSNVWVVRYQYMTATTQPVTLRRKGREVEPRIDVQHNWFKVDFVGDWHVEGSVNGPEHRDTPEHLAECGKLARSKAEFLVRAYNKHEALVEALKAYKEYDDCRMNAYFTETYPNDVKKARLWEKARRLTVAALAGEEAGDAYN